MIVSGIGLSSIEHHVHTSSKNRYQLEETYTNHHHDEH